MYILKNFFFVQDFLNFKQKCIICQKDLKIQCILPNALVNKNYVSSLKTIQLYQVDDFLQSSVTSYPKLTFDVNQADLVIDLKRSLVVKACKHDETKSILFVKKCRTCRFMIYSTFSLLPEEKKLYSKDFRVDFIAYLKNHRRCSLISKYSKKEDEIVFTPIYGALFNPTYIRFPLEVKKHLDIIRYDTLSQLNKKITTILTFC